jgi:prepilin-type N-terminal cleavage/methylation domain-containing protein
MWSIGMKRGLNRGQALSPGFTLLEVMVALAVLATAFAAALKLHSDSVEMVISSHVHSRASELAQYKMTEIELIGVKNLLLMSGEFDDLDPEYAWDINIEPTPLDPWVSVTVSVRRRGVGKGGGFQLTEYMLPESEEKSAKGK